MRRRTGPSQCHPRSSAPVHREMSQPESTRIVAAHQVPARAHRGNPAPHRHERRARGKSMSTAYMRPFLKNLLANDGLRRVSTAQCLDLDSLLVVPAKTRDEQRGTSGAMTSDGVTSDGVTSDGATERSSSERRPGRWRVEASACLSTNRWGARCASGPGSLASPPRCRRTLEARPKPATRRGLVPWRYLTAQCAPRRSVSRGVARCRTLQARRASHDRSWLEALWRCP